MDLDNNESDVLIIGAGPIGLYTALLLTKMGFVVRIIDKADSATHTSNKSFLWSPRSLQLLSTLGVSETMLKDGIRHWKFETFNTQQNSNADHQSFRVWENDVTEFNWSLSYECNKVCESLIKALGTYAVQVEYQQELVNLEDGDPVYYPHEKTVVATIQSRQGSVSHWKSRIVIGADGKRSFVRHKLGIAQYSRGKSGIFYTLEASVTSNFVGTRMSVVTKGQDAIFIVGHGHNMYFMFEHQPRWSHLTIDHPVPIEKAKRHIKSVLDPYHIEFTKVHCYYSWTGESKACEEYIVDGRFFLVGGAAQSIEPPGLLSTNLGLEQAQNLCWKLYLHLHQRASPLLLGTYEEESRSKLDDVLAASQAFVQLISNRSLSGEEDRRLHPQEHTYKLHRNRPCLVGETPYQTNLINLGTASNFSLAVSESNTITAAAQMLQHRMDPGAVGSLAQNARLKPYTMIQILLSQSNLFTGSNLKSMTAMNHTVDELTASSPPPPSPTSMSPISPPTTPSPVSHKRIDGRPRSLSSTPTSTSSSSTSSSTSSSSGWSLAKLHNVTKKVIHMHSSGVLHHDQRMEKSDLPSITNKAGAMATTAAAAGASTSTSTMSSPSPLTGERWRRIRPNYFHLLDKMGCEYSEVTFTILVFCGNIHEDEKCLTTLRKLRRYLDSSNSFIHRYETNYQYHQQQHALAYSLPMKSSISATISNSASTATSTTATTATTTGASPNGTVANVNTTPPLAETNHRASVSSFTSSHRSSLSSPNTRASYSAFSIPGSPTSMTTNMTRFSVNEHRPSFSSVYFDDDTNVTSTDDARATSFSSSKSSSSSSSGSRPLFSFLYITTSSKNEVAKCLNATPSAVIHAAFPFGLDKVYLDHDHQCHTAYSNIPSKMNSPTLVVVRPDGYIGARVRLHSDEDLDRIDHYFDSFLRPHYDQNSAAAIIAAAYDDDC